VTSPELDDQLLAPALARDAGALLLELRSSGAGGDGLAAMADRQAHECLVEGVAKLRPADMVLSEEAADDPARLAAERVWIVDPLDGTREYAEGRDDWAVHVALWHAGALTAGAVALPARGVLLTTHAPIAAPRSRAGRLRLAVSRTRPPAVATAVAEALDADLVPMGSAGVKVAAVVLGQADAYVHAGGQYEWDSAAPVAVALASGLHASRLDGSPLQYNRRDPLLPDLVVALPEIAPAVLAAAASFAASA
jgi:3'(2'), 5'-bisphosphate nucleotidase